MTDYTKMDEVTYERERALTWINKCSDLGALRELAEAIRERVRQLGSDSRGWGDPHGSA